ATSASKDWLRVSVNNVICKCKNAGECECKGRYDCRCQCKGRTGGGGGDECSCKCKCKCLPAVDGQLGNLAEKILAFFKQSPSSIHWDLAQINNYLPPSVSTQLVPNFFRFAVYAPSAGSNYTILSIFIHLRDRTHGGTEDQLQANWASQWSNANGKYGV